MENMEKILSSYEMGDPIIPDEEYDALFGDDNWHHQSSSGDTVLPVYVGSLNKIRDDASLYKWYKKYSSAKFLFTPKLDGISALYFDNKLIKRGNGKLGKDISSLLPYLNLPQCSSKVRGELVISKKDFEREVFKEYKSPRNAVAGLTSSLVLKPACQYIKFVAFKHYCNDTPQNELISLKKLGFNVVDYTLESSRETSVESIWDLYEDYIYPTDGTVVTPNIELPCEMDKNPTNMIAVKINKLFAEATVKNVEFKTSRWGQLCPVVTCEPIQLDGVYISHITGNHAEYIRSNCIGPGTKIIITRSGGVIPKIVRVVTTRYRKEDIILPEGKWDGPRLFVENYDMGSQMEFFTKAIGLKGLGPKHCNVLGQHMSPEEILTIDKHKLVEYGIPKKISANIVDQIRAMGKINIEVFIFGLGLLGKGIGKSRILSIIGNMDKDLNLNTEVIKGVKSMMENVEKNIPMMKEMVLKYSSYLCFDAVGSLMKEKKQSRFYKKICLSGYRNSALQSNPQLFVVDALTRDVDILVVADMRKETTKIKNAKKYGIQIMAKEEFEEYLKSL